MFRRLEPILVLAVLVLPVVGCQENQADFTILNPFNLKLSFLPSQEPVRIGIAAEPRGLLDPQRWDILEVGSPWTPLRRDLQRALGRPVQFEVMKPFQVAAQLQMDRLDFGFLCASDYLALGKDFGDFGKPIAISDVAVRQGLIVANARSNIHSLADIKGKRFSFGPPGDPVLDVAAKEALTEGGLPLDDIQREVFALNDKTIITVNSLQHHISGVESAFEIAYGIGTPAGVIEAAEYESWPQSGGRMLLRTFGKDTFRILARTETYRLDTMPEGPFVASAKTDPELVSQVQDFLISSQEKHRRSLMTMGLAAFHEPEADVHGEMERLVAQSPQPEAPPVIPGEAEKQ